VRALAFGSAVSIACACAAFALGAGCGTNPAAKLVVHYDAGSDDASDGSPGDVALADGLPPDASPYLGGPCVDDAQCDDHITCTYDSCDETYGRCLNVPDDTQCQDGIYCDGEEKCVPGHGCEPGPVVSCDDGDACKIARCDEPTKSCQYTPRDVDQDGDPDAHCPPGKDCNDLDPNVSSLHAEVCANGIDDNCNGLIDEHPCVVPQGDTCANAVATNGPGTYAMSTAGATHAFATSCSVATPSAAQDVVAAVTVPPGPNVDLEIWVTAGVPVAAALQTSCGDPSSEIACGAAGAATSARARARNVGPGTYYAVTTTQDPADLELKVAFLTPTPAPTDVDCGSATPVQPGTPVAVSLVDAPTNLPSACKTAAGELTYSFTLTQPQDVRVVASVAQGSGVPVVGLRSPTCSAATDEIRCAQLGQEALYARALPAGTYVLTIGGTAQIDLSFVLELSAPTTAPPDQTCASPPSLTPGQKLAFDLSNNENAIQDGCMTAGGPDAAFDLAVGAASDVLLIERIPQNESGAVSLDTPACNAASVLACSASVTPVRVATRNLASGDYRVVVADQLGQQGTVEALVRPTVAPTIIPPGGSSTCAQALDVSAGGFFTGDTSTSTATYSSGCDAPGQAPPPGQVLTFTLTQPQRVVLDMEGSQYTTILDVREGSTCPGTPIGNTSTNANGCYVGFGGQRSFLDLELTSGTYWLVIDGYQGGKGAWDLDVRILPP
jgi:hypothetical protein